MHSFIELLLYSREKAATSTLLEEVLKQHS